MHYCSLVYSAEWWIMPPPPPRHSAACMRHLACEIHVLVNSDVSSKSIHCVPLKCFYTQTYVGANWLKLLSKRILKRVLQAQRVLFHFPTIPGQSAGRRRKHTFWADKEKKQVEHKERDNCAVTGQTPSVFCFLSLLCFVVQYQSGNRFFDNMFGDVCHEWCNCFYKQQHGVQGKFPERLHIPLLSAVT